MERLKPTLHEDFEIGQRVAFDFGVEELLKGTGTIVGVATMHIIGTYIVLLDRPILVPNYDKPWKAITVLGSFMRKIDNDG